MNDNLKNEYNSINILWTNLPLFYQAWWLDIVCHGGQWDLCIYRNKKGEVRGILPFYMTKSLEIFKVIRMPPLTPTLGIWLDYSECSNRNVNRYSFEMEATRSLVNQLPKVASYHQIYPIGFQMWLPFFWNGYQQTTRYSYVLENNNSDLLWSQMKSEVRTRLRKAGKIYTLKKVNDASIFYENYNRIMKKQNLSLEIYKEMFFNLHKEIMLRNNGEIYLASNDNGEIVAGLYLLVDKFSAHYWLAFMDKDSGSQGASQLIIWQSVIDSFKRVKFYNFQGSMLENLEPIFRNFGGNRMEMYQIRKFRNPLFRFLWWVLNGRKNRMV